MLLVIGARPSVEPPSLVDRLAACHQRIRHFASLACEIGRRREVSTAEIVDACERVARYFREALPLHVADEDESIAPRLRLVSPLLADALDTATSDHRRHTHPLDALLDALGEVAQAPSDEAARERLSAVAGPLRDDLLEHLALEETVIFPAIRAHLTGEHEDTILRELRARRASSLPASPSRPA